MPELVRLTPLDDLVEERTERIAARKDPSLPYIGLEHLAQGEPTILGSGRSDASISTNAVFEAGDILFGKLRPNLHKSVRPAYRGYCSTDILVFRARPGIDPSFAAHVFQWSVVFDEAVRTAEGTKMPRTSWGRLKSFRVSLPSPREQRRIARILDTIDAAIQQTDALIAKLKVMKAGLLHDLLTRGLDEQGRLRAAAERPEEFKDTSLGSVPRAWQVLTLGSIAEIGSGVTLGRDFVGPGTVELPYLRVANVQDGYVDLGEVKTVRVPAGEAPKYLLRAGDVLMNEGGDFDKLGRGTVWRGQIDPCLHQNHVFRVRADPQKLLPEYLAAISGSAYGKRFFVLSSKQSTNLASVNSTQLKGFPIPCPPIPEQARILRAIATKQSRIHGEVTHRDKLRQVKQGLIDDLLTGGVRVGANMKEA